MNSMMQEQGYLLKADQDLRVDLLNVLADADLAYKLPGRNLTLGELCQEMGEVEQSYITGFKTFKQDFEYQHGDSAVAVSLDALRAWYETLDAELQTVLEALSEEDLQKPVDRGHGFAPPVQANFHIYREALLIFYAKAHIYLKALNKHVRGEWQRWIGDRDDWEALAAAQQG